jgi:hypothetical protein
VRRGRCRVGRRAKCAERCERMRRVPACSCAQAGAARNTLVLSSAPRGTHAARSQRPTPSTTPAPAPTPAPTPCAMHHARAQPPRADRAAGRAAAHRGRRVALGHARVQGLCRVCGHGGGGDHAHRDDVQGPPAGARGGAPHGARRVLLRPECTRAHALRCAQNARRQAHARALHALRACAVRAHTRTA